MIHVGQNKVMVVFTMWCHWIRYEMCFCFDLRRAQGYWVPIVFVFVLFDLAICSWVGAEQRVEPLFISGYAEDRCHYGVAVLDETSLISRAEI